MKEFFEKIINGFLKLLGELEKARIHYILLCISMILVILSILLDRYFFEAFSTFIYGIGVVYLMLARRHEAIGKLTAGTAIRLFVYLFIFVVWFLLWVTGIWMHSEYFPQEFWLF